MVSFKSKIYNLKNGGAVFSIKEFENGLCYAEVWSSMIKLPEIERTKFGYFQNYYLGAKVFKGNDFNIVYKDVSNYLSEILSDFKVEDIELTRDDSF